ncbi:MAG: D-alanyl-D-alanine carboxypeptidase [Clostridiales bacterium]|nr:D-alanyl-D-alanine carboxypeptidase [Clostridiales bacterium]HOA84644.1 D-alanyl-D-alanine carboxypeptidase family protein [Bacillota bacterium]
MKRLGCLLIVAAMLAAFLTQASGSAENPVTITGNPVSAELSLNCVSAILMESETGKVLYEMNADQPLLPASITKIMTLLLVMEAIEAGKLRLDEQLTCSARAASMGGSQIYLEEGEQMTVEELIKCVVISSANDAALMLAEAVAGSEEVFVDMMNKRAEELGMKNSHFENTNGLDDTVTNHVTSARDVAIMSRELIKYDKILEYSKIWMDTTRDGTFGLTNTNRLIRFYKGATGLKTGSTSKAKFCISATAKRDGMHLICVIMAAETRDIRNAAATTLLDWGFANFALFVSEESEMGEIRVTGGVDDSVGTKSGRFCCVVPKGDETKIERVVDMKESIAAPVREGEVVGTVKFVNGNETIGTADIVVTRNIEKIGFWQVLTRILRCFLIA